MTRVVLLPGLEEDFERIHLHLQQHESSGAEHRITSIVGASDVLSDNPKIGRELDEEMRELVIGRDTSGYLALYRYMEAMDTVIVMAIRAQREAGYARGPVGAA